MGLITTESRYANLDTLTDASGNLVLEDRVPRRFEARDDNLFHVSADGDTWDSLADRYYSHISERACGLFWVVMDYQDPPVVDPTLTIRPNTVIAIPSPQMVVTEILSVAEDVYL
jgi:hypothetical protein